MNISKEQLEAGAKAIWDSMPHTMIEMSGFPTEFEKQPRTLKKDYFRYARNTLKAVFGDISFEQEDANKK